LPGNSDEPQNNNDKPVLNFDFDQKTEIPKTTGPKQDTNTPNTSPKDNSTRKIPQFKDLSQIQIKPKSMFIAPWLTEKSITLISGWRGTGKTWFALSLLYAISQGKDFGPWKSGESVPCLYLDGELPIQDIKERLENINADSDHNNSPYIYSNDYESSKGYPRASLYNEKWRVEAGELLKSLGIKLWVIDNLASLATGSDENTKLGWDPINSWLLDLRFTGISTIMLQNTNKSGTQRGTSAREDNIDISIILEQPSDYKRIDGCRFIIKFTKSRVKTSELYKIEDVEFQLAQNEISGTTEWIHGVPKRNNNSDKKKKSIIKLISDGIIKKEIAKELNITPTYVSKICKSAVTDGYLTSNYALTEKGKEYLG